eukprot:752097_1
MKKLFLHLTNIMSKSAQCQTCDVSKPTCKATTFHSNYKIATTIFISKPRSNCTISSLETWAVMETKSISTHFSDTNNIKKLIRQMYKTVPPNHYHHCLPNHI